MTNYDKIKLTQAVAVIATIATLILAFNIWLLILGLIVSWLFYCFGLAICLHKFTSHRTFEAKNKFIKYLILWAGTQVTMGSTINFAAGHRQHHIKSDTSEDPYYLEGGTWHRIKLFFYWFPTFKISPLIVKDLLRDSDHQFFNNHYWKILSIYPALLLLLDPIWAVYFYALPVTYVLLGMGYVTVIAHLKSFHRFGTKPYETNDNSWDNTLFGILLAGEGYHNSHHAFPGRYRYTKNDISGCIINYLKEEIKEVK
jgi:fatty-acid desaturase